VVLNKGGGVWAFPFSTIAGVLALYPAALWLVRQRQPGVRLIALKTGPDFWRYFQQLRSDAWHCLQSQVSIVVLNTIDIVLSVSSARRDATIYRCSRELPFCAFLQSMVDHLANVQQADQSAESDLNRMNAWAVGMWRAPSVTLAPFCRWIGTVGSGPRRVWSAARFLVTSLAAPTAYLLHGRAIFGRSGGSSTGWWRP
jgi:hypothetical protein